MQNQGEDQPCRIKLEWVPTKHQVPKQGAREFLRLGRLPDMPVTRVHELLPWNWKTTAPNVKAA